MWNSRDPLRTLSDMLPWLDHSRALDSPRSCGSGRAARGLPGARHSRAVAQWSFHAGVRRPGLQRSRVPATTDARGKFTRSIRLMKVRTSPPAPHPKQCQRPFAGVTVNDGVFSTWNGQSPTRSLPRRLSFTYWPMIAATFAAALTRSASPVKRPSGSPARPARAIPHVDHRSGMLARLSLRLPRAGAARRSNPGREHHHRVAYVRPGVIFLWAIASVRVSPFLEGRRLAGGALRSNLWPARLVKPRGPHFLRPRDRPQSAARTPAPRRNLECEG